MRLPVLLTMILAALALGAVACSQAAELIPGKGTGGTPPPTTPAPVVAPPLVAPGTLRLAGAGSEGANRAVVPDAELARAIVHLRALNPEGAPVREGAGVIVDRRQRLVLTSYLLADPFTAEGARAYDRLVVG